MTLHILACGNHLQGLTIYMWSLSSDTTYFCRL